MAWSVAALLLTAVTTSPANADSVSCASAAEAGQDARDHRELRRARASFVECASAECPVPISRDCLVWLEEIDKNLPSVVFFADAGSGRDLIDVKVWIEGELVATRLDGRSIPVEPGTRRVRFAWGSKEIERDVLFVEGEKNRKIDAHFSAEAHFAAEAVVARARGPWPWIAGTIGVVGLASFTGFALSGRSAVSQLENCSPTCDPRDVDAARTKYLVADISLAIGIVGLGVATVLFLTRGDERAPSSR